MVSFYHMGECHLMAKFGDKIDKKLNLQIHQISKNLESKNIDGIEEISSSYVDLVINYNPLIIDFEKLSNLILKEFESTDMSKTLLKTRVVEIPTCYDDEFALDKNSVMSHTKLSWKEIVKIHTKPKYLVYMMGFMPGFCYLGGMDKKIATPRLSSPREKIPAGSVGIAGAQTGIYPSDSPGGWQIIAKTPLKMYDIKKEQSSVVLAGDYIRYKEISKSEFYEIKDMIKDGKFEIKSYYE